MSEFGFDEERLIAAFQDPSGRMAEGEPCPTAETIWAAARGVLDVDARQSLVEHTGRCPSCAEDWRVARRLVREMPGSKSRPRNRTGHWLAAAAVLFLTLGAFGMWWLLDQEPPVQRGGGGTAHSEAPIESLVVGEALSRRDPVLRWRGPEGASYRLTVLAGFVTLVDGEDVEGATEYRLSNERIEDLPAGSELDWKLIATLADGTELSSPPFRARLE